MFQDKIKICQGNWTFEKKEKKEKVKNQKKKKKKANQWNADGTCCTGQFV